MAGFIMGYSCPPGGGGGVQALPLLPCRVEFNPQLFPVAFWINCDTHEKQQQVLSLNGSLLVSTTEGNREG
jgi:hypothetical protein